MDDLVKFLRARLDEYEAEVRGSGDGRVGAEREWLLADIESKRRILDECNWGGPDHADIYDAVLRRLALPYADHEDYRPEWKP